MVTFYLTNILFSGGSKSLAPPPQGSKFFQFHAFFGKILQHRMLAPPGELAPPPRGNSGSATAIDKFNHYLNWQKQVIFESLHKGKAQCVIIYSTHNSKRQDGYGFIGENGYIFHESCCCIKVLIGGAYAHMFEDLLQVITTQCSHMTIVI